MTTALPRFPAYMGIEQMWPVQPRNDSAAAQSFTALVRQHQSMVFSIAMRMLGDAGIAEEVAQDV